MSGTQISDTYNTLNVRGRIVSRSKVTARCDPLMLKAFTLAEVYFFSQSQRAQPAEKGTPQQPAPPNDNDIIPESEIEVTNLVMEGKGKVDPSHFELLKVLGQGSFGKVGLRGSVLRGITFMT